MSEPTQGPEYHRAEIVKDMKRQVVRIQDELETMIKMVAFQREALQNEMLEGMGYKKLAADGGFLNKLKTLTMAIETLVDSKIKFDKHARHLAETMTPDEELKAVREFIKTLESPRRYTLLRDLMEWHRNKELGREDSGS